MNCRWCAGDLQLQPLLTLRGIPRGAQSLPLRDLLSLHQLETEMTTPTDENSRGARQP